MTTLTTVGTDPTRRTVVSTALPTGFDMQISDSFRCNDLTHTQ